MNFQAVLLRIIGLKIFNIFSVKCLMFTYGLARAVFLICVYFSGLK